MGLARWPSRPPAQCLEPPTPRRYGPARSISPCPQGAEDSAQLAGSSSHGAGARHFHSHLFGPVMFLKATSDGTVPLKMAEVTSG